MQNMRNSGRRDTRTQLEATHRGPNGPVRYAVLGGQYMRVDRPSFYRDAIVIRKLSAIKTALARIAEQEAS